MPNVQAPFGFQQRRGLGASPTYENITGQVNYNTANIFNGDPIFRLSADGTFAGVTTGPGPGATSIAGVFIGCEYLSVSQKRKVWSNWWVGSDVAANGLVEIQYINDPAAQFKAQVGGSASVGLLATQNGLNVQFAYGTGNQLSGQSGAFVDISVTPAATATLPFRFKGLILDPPGSPGTLAGQYNIGQFAFNNVETKTLTAV